MYPRRLANCGLDSLTISAVARPGAQNTQQAIKIIAGAGEPLRGRMLIYDALYGENRVVSLKPRDGCPVCGGRHEAARGA